MENQSAYLHTLMHHDETLMELETYAESHHIPIMDKLSMQFLCQLIDIHQPRTILEIGTAIGYSTIHIARTLPHVEVMTLEKDTELVEIANKNIQKFKLNHRVSVISGDALVNLKSIATTNKTFDFIFIDAAKGKYEEFFTSVAPMLSDNGLIVCDNVLFKGFVADPDMAPTPRLKKLAIKIKHFNNWLINQSEFSTSIIPIGDGISISKK